VHAATEGSDNTVKKYFFEEPKNKIKIAPQNMIL
jgi:hypothetical protein